jgi:phosphatidylserine/phosphatidylglycerophosphate/cardiolipin synthase-like enzyme
MRRLAAPLPLLPLLPAAALCLLLAVVPSGSAEGGDGRTRLVARFSPGGGAADLLAHELRRARRRIDAALYVLTCPRLARELVAAHRRGVDVRVLVDARAGGRRGSEVGRIEAAGVRVGRVRLARRPEDPSDPLFHHKFAVLDEATVITGSFNWTQMAERRNHEDLLLVADPAVARAYRTAFERVLASLDAGSGAR